MKKTEQAQNTKSRDPAPVLSSARLSSHGGMAGTILPEARSAIRDKHMAQAKSLLGQ